MFSIKRLCCGRVPRIPRIPRIPRSIYQIGGFREVWHVKSDGNLLALRHRCYWVPVPRSKPWRCSRATRTCTPQRTSGSPVWPLDGCFWTVFSAMIIVKVTKSPQFPQFFRMLLWNDVEFLFSWFKMFKWTPHASSSPGQVLFQQDRKGYTAFLIAAENNDAAWPRDPVWINLSWLASYFDFFDLLIQIGLYYVYAYI